MPIRPLNRTKVIQTLIFTLATLPVFLMVGCQSTNYNSNLPAPTVRRAITNLHTTPTVQSNRWQKPSTSYHKWAPQPTQGHQRPWKGIIIHHSATNVGDAISIGRYHKNVNGWDELGYHFIINNGNNSHGLPDGSVEVGRRWKVQKHGAHCRVDVNDDNHWNEHYIGICLVGNFQNNYPSSAQYNSLNKLVQFLKTRYHIPTSKICGHGDIQGAKTSCPGRHFSWTKFKRSLTETIARDY